MADFLIYDRQNGLESGLLIIPGDKTDLVPVVGKLIVPESMRHPHLQNLLVVLPGLPGNEWGLAMDRKAHNELQKSDDRGYGYLRLIPPGVNQEYDVGCRGNLFLESRLGFARNRPFSFENFTRYFSLALRKLYEGAPENFRIHAAGHSYGAISLLAALRYCLTNGVRLPRSVNFLAPFVKIALDAQNPTIALNILDTREHCGRVLSPDAAEEELERILRPCKTLFVTNDQNPHHARDLVAAHKRTFDDAFFRTIGDLSAITKQCAIRVIRGDQDEYLNHQHADLIARITGTQRETIEKVLKKDGHNLTSLDIAELFAA